MRTKYAWFALTMFLGFVTGCGGCDDGGGVGGSDDSDGGPLSKPIKDCAPTPLPTTGDIQQDCVNRINQFRAECQRLPPLMRWTDGEICANQMAQYDSVPGRAAHAGFKDDICTGGSAQCECPAWGSNTQVINGCLQAMWDEGPGTPFSEHGHYLTMASQSYSAVACGFFTDGNGKVWAVQNYH